MTPRIKICGITSIEDARMAVNAGASALGFIFHKKSPRYVSPSKVRTITESLPPFVTPVGVFLNHSEHAVRDICRLARVSTVQFHGEESPGYCKSFNHFKIIKAFRVSDIFNFKSVLQYKVDAYLFDTFQEDAAGGTGKTFNWELLKNYQFDKPVILSGGLNPENVRQAIETVQPYAVDVSSGVEKSPGVKGYHLVNAFCQAASQLGTPNLPFAEK
ncbi:MAG: phosphoribosylanthranilate isomerase [Candidatus Omnitrophica bacterium]|nr:phosphoribosylanthranilate isomerase [Candidatus Omnitrophota bacterium]